MTATFSTLTNEQLLDILVKELTEIDVNEMIDCALRYEIPSIASDDERKMYTIAGAIIGAVLIAYRERKAANS